jgi:DNA-binding MarR family transcriptional regulator
MPAKRARSKREEEVTAAMVALRRIVRSLRLAAVSVERELGISVAQLFVMQQLGDGRPRSINELAEQTVTDPSTVSGVVRRLIDQKLVRRQVSPVDGRRAEVSLTAAGRSLLQRAPEAPQQQLVAALAEMTDAERRSLLAGLIKLADHLGPANAALFFEDDTPPRRPR